MGKSYTELKALMASNIASGMIAGEAWESYYRDIMSTPPEGEGWRRKFASGQTRYFRVCTKTGEDEYFESEVIKTREQVIAEISVQQADAILEEIES
jgi:hypothetical protein